MSFYEELQNLPSQQARLARIEEEFWERTVKNVSYYVALPITCYGGFAEFSGAATDMWVPVGPPSKLVLIWAVGLPGLCDDVTPIYDGYRLSSRRGPSRRLLDSSGNKLLGLYEYRFDSEDAVEDFVYGMNTARIQRLDLDGRLS